MANLPHVTAQPDLLPWNATGCCAGDKKRQRLKLQGGNTPWSWRAAQLRRERKKKFSGFPRTPLPLPPSTPPPLPPPNMPPPPTVIPISARSPPTMTHVCAHTNAQAHNSHPLLEGDQKCFGRCLAHIKPIFFDSSLPLPLSPLVSGADSGPCPAPQSA